MILVFQTVLLQSGQGGGTNYTSFIMLGGMIAIFYLFFIRPQQKKQKDTRKFIEALQKGDMVVTVGGIHGKVLNVDESTATVEVDKGTKLIIDKSSISLESSKRFTK